MNYYNYYKQLNYCIIIIKLMLRVVLVEYCISYSKLNFMQFY